MPDFTLTLSVREARALQILADTGYGAIQEPGEPLNTLSPQELVRRILRNVLKQKRDMIDGALRAELTEGEVKAVLAARAETDPRAGIYD